MDTPAKAFYELVEFICSWFPKKTKSANVSRDFWMPDHSCRVCYECDSQFTIFNRRHHCRLCGRIFCGKCTANSIPAPSDEPKTGWEEWERIRVCNYCFKQREQEISTNNNGIQVSSPNLSPSPSATSLVSSKTSGTANTSSTTGSVPYSSETYHHVSHGSDLSPGRSVKLESSTDKQAIVVYERNTNPIRDTSPNRFGFCMNRSDDDYDEYTVYQSDSETRQFPQSGDYYVSVDFDVVDHAYAPNKVIPDKENINIQDLTNSTVIESLDSQELGRINMLGRQAEGHNNGDECNTTSLYGLEVKDIEPVDFENNGLLWLLPGPEDEEDDREVVLFDDDDDDATGEWRYLRSTSSFGSGEFRSKDRSSEEHKKAMKSVVDGHFRALVAQLLQVENLSVGEEDDSESWLEIITSLSWEAATLLKPDTSKGGGMDPGGYVKVKCLACGRRSESMVVKGVVCKKNVAHRRMTSKIEKPRFLILGGALEYQRVSNSLSSIDTLLQQEMDHLKMAVAKIDAQHPNVLLVEKTVSRFAQDYLHAKDIALVLNIKRPLLERIARCTGAQIVPSIDHLSSRKLGYCDTFHVEKFLEEHGSAGQAGKKLVKTLMFFDDCPKPLGYTILLKGANGDELKKVKHVVQYGVFAAYHLAMETCFLADEGASLPELPLKSPITVALPDKPSSIDGSISTIPGFTVPVTGKALGFQTSTDPQKLSNIFTSELMSPIRSSSVNKWDMNISPFSFKSPLSQFTGPGSNFINSPASISSLSPNGQFVTSSLYNELSYEEKCKIDFDGSLEAKTYVANNSQDIVANHHVANDSGNLEATGQGAAVIDNPSSNALVASKLGTSELATLQQDGYNYHEELGSSKEDFPQGTPDHQSILVFLSSRSIWKGTVCERAHLFRIKYYGSSDKPLGRFLRDHLFDQSFRCRSCEMPSEAHVHSYTHRQGTLTISVKKIPEVLLPGEREGKIWMWHRCLRCPRTDGFPPATRRVVMSDAAWGLSFGKFLELSFSNHAAASRVASCGHSLHRDCLRFYGFGKMVACFRYASIDVHSVYLPPSKLDFKYDNQEWIEKEANEVFSRAQHLFNEIVNILNQMAEKRSCKGSPNSSSKAAESKCCFIANLESMLQMEQTEFEESFRKAFNREVKYGQPIIDILEINRLRRQLIFHSYLWDRRLVYVTSFHHNCLQEKVISSIQKREDKPLSSVERPAEINSTSGALTSGVSLHVDVKSSEDHNQGGNHPNEPGIICRGGSVDQVPNHVRENQTNLCTSISLGSQSDPLESGIVVHRTLSEGQFPSVTNLSDTLETAWTGENHPGNITPTEDVSVFHDAVLGNSSRMGQDVLTRQELEQHSEEDQGASNAKQFLGLALPVKVADNTEDSTTWLRMSFTDFYQYIKKNSSGSTLLDTLGAYNPVYVLSFRELERLGGVRLFLPMGVNDTVVPVYDDEPTSIISFALVSPDYHAQLSDERERPKDGLESSVSLPTYDSMNLHTFHSFDETTSKVASESLRTLGSMDESILSMSGPRSSLVLDPLMYSKSLHASVSFTDDGPLGKVKYTVICYYAKRFDALRRICCPSELDFVRSLSRCKKWGAQGGKSNVFFAKSLDDRFIIKQVTKTELESFMQFAPEYFKYLSESIVTGSPTCLAKILGIYQVTSKHHKGGKESRMDVLVMENLLFGRNVTRLYDLKGSSRSRYNPDASGSNKVLLDQNLIEAMPTSPIFVGNKAKRLLERAVWNDTSFLTSIDVMDYSLLVGVDEEKHELVLGIIDFVRQYTWDKHLETWVKASGILGGPKNSTPTVISPLQYKKRFRKAMSEYFLMVPDQWSPPTIIPSGSQSDLYEENKQGGTFLE